ncbi:MAG: hypothetical protein ACI87W_003451 [Halieaceae bacterium]|jgi:hypothetical protein
MSIGNIDYRRWKEETAVTGKLRSGQLRELDKAIESYCKQGGGGAANLAGVKAKFRAWKGSSIARNTSSRNKSGIVKELEGYLTGTIPMSNAYLDSQQDGRRGLLYVYSGLQVDAKLFNLVIDSAWELGGAAFSFEGTQKDIQKSIGGNTLTTAQKKQLSQLPGKVLGSDLVKKGRDAVVGKAQDAYAAKQNPGAPPTPPPRPAPGNVPGGPLKRGNPATGGAFRINRGLISSSQFEKQVLNPPSALEQFGSSAIEAIRAKLRALVDRIVRALRKQYDSLQANPYDFTKVWATRIAGLINFIVCKILGEVGKTVAPIVGGAIGIARGVADTIGACTDKYETWILSKGVNIAPGHPQAVMNSLNLIQSVGIGKGIYDTLKGATQLGLDVGAAASGAIFGLITSCCEVLAKFIHRLWDVSRLESFSRKCKEMYQANETPRAGEFGAFLRSYVMTCPSIACVAMVSNYAGDAMQWLDMNSGFNTGAKVSGADWKAGNPEFDLTAASFLKGTELLVHMKKNAASFLSDSGFKFNHSDPSVAHFLTAKNLKSPAFAQLTGPEAHI